MTRLLLTRRIFTSAIVFGSLALSGFSIAQTHKVGAAERVTRAVAVYEWTGDLDKPKAARLVPVSLFIDGRLRDAGVYLSRPVPFALQEGDLYAVEQAGEGKGMFSVDHARNVATKSGPMADVTTTAWYGFGKFAPPKAAAKAPVLPASTHLATIASSADPSRPHFSSKADTKAETKTPSGKTDTADKSSPAPSSKDDADRPQLKRTADKDAGDAKSAPDTKDGSAKNKDEKDSKDDLDRPTLRKRDPAEDEKRRKNSRESSVSGPEFSLNEDPDRPTMRRGAAPGAESTSELSGLPAELHQVAAVSDPANRDAHIFAREWESPTERADTLAKLQALARPRMAAYVSAYQLVLGPPVAPPPPSAVAPSTAAAVGSPAPAEAAPSDGGPPKMQRGKPEAYRTPSAPAKPTSSAHSTPPVKAPAATARSKAAAAKARPTNASKSANAPLVLANEQLLPYTLSYGGLPTFVYTAQADVRTGGPVYLTLVAQRLVSGDLQVALSSVTDASHLDRTPWLRPVDAVDPDASHRASLLFELRAQSSRQFALYRLTSAQAEQIFLTGVL